MSNASHQSTVGKTIAWRGPSRAGTTTPLPADLLQSASKRLALLAIVMSALVGVWIILNAALQLGEMTDLAEVLCYGAAFAISATVFVLARSGRLAPQRKLDVGLVYLVAIAAIGLVFRLLGPDEIRIPTEGASEACIIILLFPVLVPNTPGKVFTASLLAASMDPLGVALAGWAGKEMPTWTAIAGAYFWNYLCVGLAVVSSHVLYGLGREVSRAREMGAYRLTEKLGEGGMGEVWKARHHLLARDAAIRDHPPGAAP